MQFADRQRLEKISQKRTVDRFSFYLDWRKIRVGIEKTPP